MDYLVARQIYMDKITHEPVTIEVIKKDTPGNSHAEELIKVPPEYRK